MICRVLAAGAFVAFVAFSAWYSASGDQPASPSASATPSAGATAAARLPASTPTPSSFTGAPVDGPEDADPDGSGVPVPATATATPGSQTARTRHAQARAAAETFLRAFAVPARTVTRTQWWARVQPLFSPRVVEDYAGTDPRGTGFTRLAGPGVVVPTDGPADLLTAVAVPTDGGTWRIELERDESGRFLVTRAIPPQELKTAP